MYVEDAFIVDAGCGSGSATLAALRMGMYAIGYDCDEQAVKGVTDR
jgi:ribosomal protein L11 methylase PrmA